ncbi:MAG: Rrf2 family transcriptional regulator [Acidobacteria bacterium]|nr:Rrf2 family transcriptional regulator [Acidobacteriota bacterium]
MKITALEEYGLRCMMQLASDVSDAPMTGAQVAENEGLTSDYAGKLLNLLSQAGLVESVRGRNGGFVLARPADEITVADIVRALSNDIFDSEYCDRHGGSASVCVHEASCALRPVWSTVSEMVTLTLQSITLLDLLRSERQLSQELQPLGELSPTINRDSPGAQTVHRLELRDQP